MRQSSRQDVLRQQTVAQPSRIKPTALPMEVVKVIPVNVPLQSGKELWIFTNNAGEVGHRHAEPTGVGDIVPLHTWDRVEGKTLGAVLTQGRHFCLKKRTHPVCRHGLWPVRSQIPRPRRSVNKVRHFVVGEVLRFRR